MRTIIAGVCPNELLLVALNIRLASAKTVFS